MDVFPKGTNRTIPEKVITKPLIWGSWGNRPKHSYLSD